MNKRGAPPPPNPSQVAQLVALIGAGIIIYILALAPSDRADLLGENLSSSGDGKIKYNITVLLEEEPGTLEFLDEDEIEIEFPSFNLYTRTDSIIIDQYDSIYLKRSLFNKEFANVTFKVDELKFTDNILLSFFARKFGGRLTIKLNGNIIFNRELQTSSPGPLQIPKEIIKKDLNIIEFEISGPGLQFWGVNEAILENIKITGDLTDTSGQENKQIFILTEKEKKLLEFTELVLVPDCDQTDVAPLEIYINKKLIFSSVPDCGIKMPIPQITNDKLKEGENFIRFRSDKGNYLIYGVELSMKLEEPIYPTYYFQLSQNEFDNIDDDEADINLTLIFPNKIDYKKGIILINEDIIEIETRDNYYFRDISAYVREGNNALEIRPKSDQIDILEVEIVYAE